MHRTTKGRPRGRKTGRALLGLAVVASVAFSASGASAAVARGADKGPVTGIEACQALAAGTVPVGSSPRRDAIAAATKSCAITCGTLASSPTTKGKSSKALTDEALLACASACDFIVFLGAADAHGPKATNGPIADAVVACELLAAANPGGTAGLPLIENGGRSWR